MRKLIFSLFLFVFSVSTCHVEAQTFRSTVGANIGRNFSTTDTNAAGEQLFVNIGDSNSDGRGTTLGPTVGSGVLSIWNGSSFTAVTTADVSNGGVGNGTYLKQFALDYNARTGNLVRLIQDGSGGSNFYPDGDANNWYTTGTLYTPMKARVRAAMLSLGVTRVKGIFVTLGVNDNRAGTSLANIQTGITSLFTRLRADFPGATIIINQVGRSEVGSPSNEETFGARLYAIRGYLIDEVRNNSNSFLLGAPIAGIGISGHYNADNLHYSQTMNNFIGSQIDRVFINKDTYSKWATNVISSMYDELSGTRKGLISTFIDGQITSGNWWKMEHFTYYKTTVQNNCFLDWTFRGYLFNNTSVTFTANDFLSSNGTSNHYLFTFYSQINTANASQNDFIVGTKIKTNNTAAGTSATLFGSINASSGISVGQNTTPATTWRANDGTISTYVTETKPQSGNFYWSARNSSTNKIYGKNTSSLATATVSSVGVHVVGPVIGAFNNNGTVGSRISAEFHYTMAAVYSTFDLTSFYNDAETMQTGW